jgi:hypothetical protein
METWQTEYQLAYSSPEFIFEWLKEYGSQKHTFMSDFAGLEKTLLSKNNKLINLGLALYATEETVGYHLYETGEHAIKRACLSGRSVKEGFISKSWIIKYAVLDEILFNYKEDGALELLEAIFQNPYLPDSLLVDLYSKNDIFSDIEEDVWVCIVGLTYRNKRIATPRDSLFMDGYDEYTYNKVFATAWMLFKTLPVTTDNARMLIHLSENLVPYCPHDMNVFKVIKRWRSDNDEDESIFADVRARLVCLLSDYDNNFTRLKDSKDSAKRRGYYKNLRHVTGDQVDEYFAKDGEIFLNEALYNEAYFKSDDAKKRLRHACWNVEDDISMNYPNWYNAREAYLSQLYPEWFADGWDGEIIFNSIKDEKLRTEKRLEALNHQTGKLYKAILGSESDIDDGYRRDTIFTEKGLLKQLELELINIGKQFVVLYEKPQATVWGWIVFGAVIGLITGFFIGQN